MSFVLVQSLNPVQLRTDALLCHNTAKIPSTCRLEERLGHHAGADLSRKSILDELKTGSPDGPDWCTDRAQECTCARTPVEMFTQTFRAERIGVCHAFFSNLALEKLSRPPQGATVCWKKLDLKFLLQVTLVSDISIMVR